jgi:phenylacetate-CoA ligase
MAGYLRELHRCGPVVLQAYARSARAFADYVAARGLKAPQFTGIISTAEVLSPEDRQVIESVFACRAYDRYGCREVGLIASQCSEVRHLHINAESVFVEFVRDGRPVAPGEPGEILITDLWNYAMPLVRYRIQDAGSPVLGNCPCGRGLPLMEMVTGRVTDFIVRPDGSLASGIALCTYLITEIPGLAQMQIVQPSLAQLVFRIVPGATYSSADLEALRARAERYLGSDFAFTFDLVGAIPREPSGKYRFTVSHVSPGWVGATSEAVASRHARPDSRP